ncbi:hypothetical protein ABPG72_004390 [Tetrahymena utriculariae]
MKSSLKLVLFFDQVYDKENKNPLNQYGSDEQCSQLAKRKINQDQLEVKLNKSLTQKIEKQNDQDINQFDSKQCQQKEELFLDELNEIKDDKKQMINTKRPIKQLKDYAIEQDIQDRIRKIIKTDNNQIEQMNEKQLYELEHSIESNLEYLNEKCAKINGTITQVKNSINSLRKRKTLFQNQQEAKDSQQIKYQYKVKIQKY